MFYLMRYMKNYGFLETINLTLIPYRIFTVQNP